jgi:radical SAM protein with 4Fe4S-binding SPASM domain
MSSYKLSVNGVTVTRDDVFADPAILERFRRHHNATIDCVFSARNYDIQEILAYFANLGIDSDRINFEIIMDTGIPRDLVDFDWDDYQRSMDAMEERLYRCLVNGEPTSEMGFANPLIYRLRWIISGDADPNILEKPKCGVGYDSLNVDLEGNCYLCHNSSIKIGTIHDSYETLVQYFVKYDKYVRADECQSCPVLALCGGGCLLVTDEARQRYYCRMNRILFGSIRNAILRASHELHAAAA